MIRHRPNKSGPAPDSCPLEGSLKLLAGAWTPKILWYLRLEPRRFGDLKRDLGTISAKVLTTRLRELEKRGVVIRTVMPTSPPTVEYALTELGAKLNPVLDSIVEVGRQLPPPDSVAAKKAASTPVFSGR
ncbi:MAG TPA: helix-turn-helix domain-containing protein [bacterium]|nr:helix-turn-helix domain-containing protein [bacterium]